MKSLSTQELKAIYQTALETITEAGPKARVVFNLRGRRLSEPLISGPRTLSFLSLPDPGISSDTIHKVAQEGTNADEARIAKNQEIFARTPLWRKILHYDFGLPIEEVEGYGNRDVGGLL